jgi:hypothetical protein
MGWENALNLTKITFVTHKCSSMPLQSIWFSSFVELWFLLTLPFCRFLITVCSKNLMGGGGALVRFSNNLRKDILYFISGNWPEFGPREGELSVPLPSRPTKPTGRCLRVKNYKVHKYLSGARTFKCLWGLGIDSKEWIPPAYVAWRDGTKTIFLLGALPP